MTVKDLSVFLDDWAPPGVAWERDNPGLQVGDTRSEVKKILLCLDTTERTVLEALEKNCNVIISHHPLIFHSLKKIDTAASPVSRVIALLLKHDITLLSYHTNLDFTRDGVSFALAKKIGLSEIRFLKPARGNQSKLVVFVPQESLEKVAAAMFEAGAGRIGNYTRCSYRTAGEGTFYGSEESNPAAGQKEHFEKVAEIRFEALCDNWKTETIVAAMLQAHPYEQPAYDIYPLQGENVNYGAGAIGVLGTPLEQKDFITLLKEKLGLSGIRFARGRTSPIRKVAVCGGAGSDLLGAAIREGADAFITADVSYHTFREAHENILLADAGHFETEIIVLGEMEKRLNDFIRSRGGSQTVSRTAFNDNPVQF